MSQTKEDMLPVQLKRERDELVLMVRRDFLSGVAVLSMLYDLGGPGLCNNIGRLQISFGWLRENGKIELSHESYAKEFVPRPEIVGGLNLAMEYFGYIWGVLEDSCHPDHKKIPISFEQFLETRPDKKENKKGIPALTGFA